MIPIALAFHTEKLHDDKVWRRVERTARWMAQKDMKATFFVYPFRAQVIGQDVTDRVRVLAGLGHEIGQHTHFYAGTKLDKPEKVDDLSEANIAHCLYRDFEKLDSIGFPPKGFTAGSWFVNETVWAILLDLGFTYDCSAQFPKPQKTAESPYNRWRRSPEFFTNRQGRILCLPTTCSLSEWFKWGRKVKTEDRVGYQLVYLHDYDLLSFRICLLLSCFLKISMRHNTKSLNAIAHECFFREEESDGFRSCNEI